MNNNDYIWLAALPYLLGSSLFLIGAARLSSRGDKIGAAIFGFAGVLAIILALVSYSRRIANSN